MFSSTVRLEIKGTPMSKEFFGVRSSFKAAMRETAAELNTTISAVHEGICADASLPGLPHNVIIVKTFARICAKHRRHDRQIKGTDQK
jgi:hypothetical protein